MKRIKCFLCNKEYKTIGWFRKHFKNKHQGEKIKAVWNNLEKEFIIKYEK